MRFHPELPAKGAVAILGVPADDKSSFMPGAAAAPDLIRGAFASDASNQWTETGIDLGTEPSFVDAGDIPLKGVYDADAIRAACSGILERGARILALGGDHAVSFPLVEAAAARYGRELSVLQFDAHPDLYDSYLGDRASHASPFARIMENGLVSGLTQAGIRTMNGHQRGQAVRFGVRVVDMRAWARGQRPEMTGRWYLSLDLDALDPAFAPGVSHREPGGLSTRDIIDLVQTLGGELVGADIVEYNPIRDLDGLTAIVAAKLLKEISGRMLADARR